MKIICRNIVSAILCLYLIVTSVVFEPYYNWEYANTHGYWDWLQCGEVFASMKATIWPLYVFAHSGSDTRPAIPDAPRPAPLPLNDYHEPTPPLTAVASPRRSSDVSGLPNAYDETAKHVVRSGTEFNQAVAVINRQTPYSALSDADLAEIKVHLHNALVEANQANIASMNQHYPGFGDHFARECIPSMKLLVAHYETGDLQSAVSADRLLSRWCDWEGANINAIRGR